MTNEVIEQRTVTTDYPAGSVQTRTVTARSRFSDFFVSKVNQVIFAILGIINLLILLRLFFTINRSQSSRICCIHYEFNKCICSTISRYFPITISRWILSRSGINCSNNCLYNICIHTRYDNWLI